MRAAREIGRSGDNDTLPYDPDARFIKEKAEELSDLCHSLSEYIASLATDDDAKGFVNSLEVFSERLLAPAGAHGFRIITKIHPFWNLYLNGLAIAISEKVEGRRSQRVYSYRASNDSDRMFDPSRSWPAYRLATSNAASAGGAVVVQTDISSFYERIYHHRLENLLSEYVSIGDRIPLQMDRLLSKMSAGRSFGLPVGGQCSRVLAEVMLLPIDDTLTEEGVEWFRFVDDFTLLCDSQESAYRALSILSHALADYGLSLNRTKTTILSARHFNDYVTAQLGDDSPESISLRQLDLHFDPYSDNALTEYRNLQQTVSAIDFEFLLNLERQKSQPDNFVVSQISRSLQYQAPETAASLCATLLDPQNLDAFRASWSKILRGVYAVRSNVEFEAVFDEIDGKLDCIPRSVSHLLLPEVNSLHFLRLLRFKKTEPRARYVRQLFDQTRSVTVKRACIECWQYWNDNPNFTRLRNQWPGLSPEVQRMLWLSAPSFGDDGTHARQQLKRSAGQYWALGFEQACAASFSDIFIEWSRSA
jgi:hypothetical protein